MNLLRMDHDFPQLDVQPEVDQGKEVGLVYEGIAGGVWDDDHPPLRVSLDNTIVLQQFIKQFHQGWGDF